MTTGVTDLLETLESFTCSIEIVEGEKKVGEAKIKVDKEHKQLIEKFQNLVKLLVK